MRKSSPCLLLGSPTKQLGTLTEQLSEMFIGCRHGVGHRPYIESPWNGMDLRPACGPKPCRLADDLVCNVGGSSMPSQTPCKAKQNTLVSFIKHDNTIVCTGDST